MNNNNSNNNDVATSQISTTKSFKQLSQNLPEMESKMQPLGKKQPTATVLVPQQQQSITTTSPTPSNKQQKSNKWMNGFSALTRMISRIAFSPVPLTAPKP